MLSQSLANEKRIKTIDTSWDFKAADTKYSNHGFHSYPAMMIPQVARRLIITYGTKAEILLDPFMGSGTALLEATLHPNFKKAYGIDINPLALLIAKVKTTPIKPDILKDNYRKFLQKCNEDFRAINFKEKGIEKPNFFNIDFWFKPQVITDLAVLKSNIDRIDDENIRNFFLVAFSETVRSVSNTRSNEYKLYRKSKSMLKKHNPNTFLKFKENLESNLGEIEEYFKEYNEGCKVHILAEDTRNSTSIPDEEIDLIVTSPPYGDSRTTVAYGQFSRLALQWLGYDKKEVLAIDKVSLGGVPTKDLENGLESPYLAQALKKIVEQDPKRARDVLSFYVDFAKCVKEIDRITKRGAFLCFVVGNRTVKGVQIPTDDIITDLFQVQGSYKHHHTFIRNIPNKRMPKLNSPTNIKGNHAVTMNEEWIVILEKQ